MSRHIVLKVALLTILLLVMTTTRTAATGLVDAALQDIGSGSIADMKGRIFSLSFSVHSAEDSRQAISSLPQRIRESKISQGALLRRVERVVGPVLRLHGRSDKNELFLYRDRFPRASVWLGCVLLISDALAESLRDEELAGIVAHEMAHAYFMMETIKARKHADKQAMRIIELKCDAVAMLSLKLLGHDPSDYLKGLRIVTSVTRRNGYNTSINSWDYPPIGERAEFAARFIRLLT